MLRRKLPIFISCAFGLLVEVTAAIAAPRLFLDSRPTNLDPTDPIGRLIFRELPRQALIVSATEDFGATCIDPTVEPTVVPRDGDTRVGLDRKALADRMVLSVSLFDYANHPLGTFELQQRANEYRLVYLDELAAKCDEEVQQHWQAILANQLKTPFKAAKWDLTLPAPDGVDRLLETIDFEHAFLAARLVHQAIRESGESPARLGALVRAYAHLGDATRHLIAGQSVGFFARSIMYAQRLARLAPKDPATWWHRAYVETLYGITIAAKADLKRADDLGGNAPPAWVDCTRELVNFRTIDLSNKSRRPDGALAAYFAWLTVENTLLQSLPISFAQQALQQNPGAVRVFDSLGANSGVGLNHAVTQEAPVILNRLVANLATDPAAPEPIRVATSTAVETRFNVPAILKLLETMDAQPDEPGQPLQWSTFASLVRESQFVNGVRRLNFVTFAWGVDPAEERAGWMPLLENHRYAPFIESYRRSTRPPDPKIVSRVKAIDFKDDGLSANILDQNLLSLGIPNDPRRGTNWGTRHRQQTGNTAYDIAQSLWLYRFADLDENPDLQEFLRTEGKSLNLVSPDHPLALGVLFIVDWPNMKARAPQLENDALTNPMLAFGLGSGYAESNQPENAKRFLQMAVQYASDKKVYEKLANVFLAQNDKQGWIDTWNTYLTKTDDVGLDHAKACEQIAYRLAADNDLNSALAYAERASGTGSAWGFGINEFVLLRMHEFEKADAMARLNGDRYDSPGMYYRFCITAGHGNLDAARSAYFTRLPNIDTVVSASLARDAGLYYYLDGNRDRAGLFWEKARQLEEDPFNSLLMALLLLEQNQAEKGIAILQEAAQAQARSGRDRAYAAAILEVLHCAKDPKAVPARDGEIGRLIKNHALPAPRGNVCYSLGRICELNHHDEDAKWWYRAAMETEDSDFTCRAMAAVALRRLNDDYFK